MASNGDVTRIQIFQGVDSLDVRIGLRHNDYIIRKAADMGTARDAASLLVRRQRRTFANSLAIAAPMPLPPPVTTTNLSASS
jgi:hypothetical protein